ncbi:unnamed protein product [Parajaminaea phylloscopi]
MPSVASTGGGTGPKGDPTTQEGIRRAIARTLHQDAAGADAAAGNEGASGALHADAPVQTVPRADFTHLEYPGVINGFSTVGTQAAESSASALNRALASISPHPPPYGNAASALEHLGRRMSLKSKVIECRPWITDHQDGDTVHKTDSTAARGNPGLPEGRAQLDLFRHPLSGELVETGNLVAVVRRRIWRKKRKIRNNDHDSSGAAASVSGSWSQPQSSEEGVKEYTVEPLGVVRTTARWRKLADFLYEPDLNGPLSTSTDRRGDDEEIVEIPAALRAPQRTADFDKAVGDCVMMPAEDTTGRQAALQGEEASRGQTSSVAGSNSDIDAAMTQVESTQSLHEGHPAGASSMSDHRPAELSNGSAQDRIPSGSRPGASEPAPPRGGLLSLYDALMRMDVKSLRSFAVPVEKEDYEVTRSSPGESASPASATSKPLSNLRMVPPPAFTRVEIPHGYAFRQPPTSSIETWQRINPDGTRLDVRRWANNSRWQGIAPHEWFFASNQPIPTQPPPQVARCRDRCDARLLRRLEALFTERPVWTRAALLNQFESVEDRRNINFNKEYVPLVAYAIRDGCYSNAYVRLGFDVRESPESRFYQILKFQTPDKQASPGRARFSKAYGGAHASGAGERMARNAQAAHEDENHPRESGDADVGSGTEGALVADTVENSGPAYSEPRQDHLFDGEHKPGRNPTFILADVTDPLARPYIEAKGPGNVLANPSTETGWFTSIALERIKAVVGVRFHTLHAEGRPATQLEVREALTLLQQRQLRLATNAAASEGGHAAASHTAVAEREQLEFLSLEPPARLSAGDDIAHDEANLPDSGIGRDREGLSPDRTEDAMHGDDQQASAIEGGQAVDSDMGGVSPPPPTARGTKRSRGRARGSRGRASRG